MGGAAKVTNKVPVFIHIEKTGGTSIEGALGLPIADHRLYVEREKDTKNPNAWVFTAIRNPFDLVVSKFNWRKYHTNQIPDKKMDFKAWCVQTYSECSPITVDDIRRFRTQKSWVSNLEGEVVLNQVLRYESLQKDFDKLCDNLGRPSMKLPHTNKTKRNRDYKTYYDAETTDVVRKYFQEDLEYWGYSFS